MWKKFIPNRWSPSFVLSFYWKPVLPKIPKAILHHTALLDLIKPCQTKCAGQVATNCVLKTGNAVLLLVFWAVCVLGGPA